MLLNKHVYRSVLDLNLAFHFILDILVRSCQHGFIAKRSCVTQLVEVFDLIDSQLNKGGDVDIIYLDMSR